MERENAALMLTIAAVMTMVSTVALARTDPTADLRTALVAHQQQISHEVEVTSSADACGGACDPG